MMRALIEDDIATVTDGTGRSVFVCSAGSGQFKWGFTCSGDLECRITAIGWRRQSQAIRGAEWHLRWHRNGKPQCVDCGADLGRKGSTRCRPGTCMEVD
jgi:hypothetical protein